MKLNAFALTVAETGAIRYSESGTFLVSAYCHNYAGYQLDKGNRCPDSFYLTWRDGIQNGRYNEINYNEPNGYS